MDEQMTKEEIIDLYHKLIKAAIFDSERHSNDYPIGDNMMGWNNNIKDAMLTLAKNDKSENTLEWVKHWLDTLGNW